MKRRLLVLLLVVSVAAVALAVTQSTRRRLRLVVLHATGKLPDMSWTDVLRMMPPRNGDGIDDLLRSRNPFEAIRNPYAGPADRGAGAASFRERCASCHGGDAHGGTGPDLSRVEQYRRGLSDWALYRTITRGIPGTAMPAHALSRRQAWELVAYVREVSGGSPRDATGRRADVAAPEVTFARLRDAARDSGNWLTYSGTLDGQRHSRLTQIHRDNVARLKVKWLYQLATTERVETSPLVIGTTMYLTSPPGTVLAIDTRSGALLWSHARPIPDDVKYCCRRANRGLAILGNTLYFATLDAHLVALDARTGTARWTVKVAEYHDGYTITGAPLAVDGKVIVGVAGGEFGIRGFLDAYEAQSGRRAWRFRTIPEPGEPGHETWGSGNAWKTGGAPTWMTGSYDPGSKLLYWTVGNPSPDYYGDVRPGDNLYSNSVLALDVETGELRWHYQFTPHDEHDWDATEILVLVDTEYQNAPRKLLLQANRNGFYYVLDRESGRFLTAKAFVRQNWNDGFDPAGRPVVRPESKPSREGTLVFPGALATNWFSPSYHPGTGLFYVVAVESGTIVHKSPDPAPRRGGMLMGSVSQPSPAHLPLVAIRALHATSGELRWEFLPPAAREYAPTGGLLSTAGGLVLGGVESRFFALDAENGRELWWINTGGQIHAAPITYLSEGRQQVTVAAGNTIVTFVVEN